VRLVLQAGGAIHGRLAYASGGAPNRFTIALGLSAPHAIASDDGSFALGDVPAGTVRLVASGADFVASTVPELVVEPGKDTDVGTLTVARGRSISGHVVDRNGRPVGNAKVVAATRIVGSGRSLDGMPAELGEHLQGKTTTTDEQGAFLLSGVGEGALVVAAEHPSAGRSNILPVADGAGSVSVDLALQQVGTISGLVTKQGQPLAQAIVTATPQGAPDAVLTVAAGGDGSFHFDSVAPGSYTVSGLFVEGGSARSKAGSTVVRSGEDARVDLDLGDSGVRLRVSAPGGDQATMFAQVIVSSVQLASGTAAALQRQLAQQTDRSLHTGFIMKGHAALISSVTPGDYTVCGIKLPGDPSDPEVAASLLHAADKLAAICQSISVAAAPSEQQIAVNLP
jgi:hypothetical protein